MSTLTDQRRQPVLSNRRLLFQIFLLTFYFLLFEVVFVYLSSRTYLSDYRMVTRQLQVPWRILPGVLGFAGAQLLVHFGFACLVYALSLGTAKSLRLTARQTDWFAWLLWATSLAFIFMANYCFFPNSRFATTLPDAMPTVWIIFWMELLGLIPLIALLACAWQVLKVMLPHWRLVAGGGVLCFWLAYFHSSAPPEDAATKEKPNIILIGVDSLRPDFLGFYGADQKTPTTDEFLARSTHFPESLTPLARTYPAWVSILTGRHPMVSGIRTNLLDVTGHHFDETLPAILRRHGYHTIFATDESRFSNIDQSYGFDRVAAPPEGVNDFLLGTLNDFPLTNPLINTTPGRYLFPYSYANRAAWNVYQPESFNQLLASLLSERRNRPAFLAVHFCLPHYPYAWSRLPSHHKVSLQHYRASIQEVDRQLAQFMRVLKDNHFLDHALVVMLSDHGEAVEIHGDRITDPDLFLGKKPISRFYPPSAEQESVDMSGGHGTDVLGLPQYHTLLAFRSYGLFPQKPHAVKGMVSLLDIHPTVLNYLKIDAQSDGISLLDAIQGTQSSDMAERAFFVESDFSPAAIRSVHPEEKDVLFEGVHFFKIDPLTTRVVVRDTMLKLILSSKQYANYRGHWVLALYPDKNRTFTPVLTNLVTGEWTNNLLQPFALHSPAKEMLAELETFFRLSGYDSLNYYGNLSLQNPFI